VKNSKALSVCGAEDYRGPWLLSLPGGTGQSFNRADEFVAVLSKALTEATDIEQLFAIWERNVERCARLIGTAIRAAREGSLPKISLRI
jgi:hypothetical protein